MRSILGKLVLAPVVMAAAALATNSAMAESNLKVPFSFTAAGKVWPAGTYAVEKDLNGDMVTVRSKDTSLSFTCLIGPGEPDPNDSHVTLKFDEVGSNHALRSVQYESQITSRLDRNASKSEHMIATGR
jgi:hypothetical protein